MHLYPSPLTFESRMGRITSALDDAGFFDRIVVVGVLRPGLPRRESLGRVRQVWRFRRPGEAVPGMLGRIIMTVGWSIQVLLALRREPVTCINCHSLPTLPLCVLLRLWHGARLIYDTHELETETSGCRGIRRPFLKVLERALIGWADVTSVVSETIADWYLAAYGSRPTTIRNVPSHPANHAPAAGPSLRERLGIPRQDLVFLFLGALSPGRRVQQLIRVFRRANPRRHLVFVGYGSYESLVREAAASAPNIHFLEAVPPEEVVTLATGADVGVAGVEDICLSYRLSLPNKLFEYMAAGIPILVPAYPEMRRIVEETGCGWVVAEDDDAWLQQVEGLNPGEAARRGAAGKAAAPNHCWAAEKEKLLSMYRHVIKARGPADPD